MIFLLEGYVSLIELISQHAQSNAKYLMPLLLVPNEWPHILVPHHII